MDHIPCYATTATQQELLDHLEQARRGADAALAEIQRAQTYFGGWNGPAAMQASASIAELEQHAWRAELRLEDIAGALHRHIRAEDGVQHLRALTGSAN